jgi:ATP-binding cassette subfamily B protein
MSQSERPRQSDWKLFGRLLRQARPQWAALGGVFVIRLLAIPLALLAPLPLKIAVDSAIGSQPMPGFLRNWLGGAEPSAGALAVAVALLILIAGLAYLRNMAGSWLDIRTGERLVLGLRSEMLKHVQRLSFAYHDARGTSDSIYRIQYDAQSIQHITMNGALPFLTAAFTVVGMVTVAAAFHWKLGLVALSVAPVLLLLTWFFRRRLRDQWYRVKEIEHQALNAVQETLSALRVVRAFGQEERERQRFLGHSERTIDGHTRIAVTSAHFDLLSGITIAAGTAAALFLGVRLVWSGDLTLGSLLMVMAYLAQIYGPLQTVHKTVTDVQFSLAGAQRCFELLDEEAHLIEKPDALPVRRAKGAVSFRNVSFAYPDGPYVLRDIDFAFPAGSSVAIAGATGAGKTTLISLLIRFYDPTEGQVLLDGVDLRDYRLDDLRDQFSLVPQEPFLFSTSIAENVAYARPGATEAEIVAAARAANAHEFIERLPEGYATRVGERGMRLSGGERQRVALARAFLRDAPILVLDEPTSSVDTQTEQLIVEAIERLRQGRTVFIISHRATTLVHCDTTLLLEQGRLRRCDRTESAAPVSAPASPTTAAGRSMP